MMRIVFLYDTSTDTRLKYDEKYKIKFDFDKLLPDYIYLVENNNILIKEPPDVQELLNIMKEYDEKIIDLIYGGVYDIGTEKIQFRTRFKFEVTSIIRNRKINKILE